MAEPLITEQDITDAFGGSYAPGTPEHKQLLFFIRFASGKARQEVRAASGLSIDDGLGDGTLDRDLMIGTMAVVVIRALSAWQQGIGVRSRQFVEETTEFDTTPDALSLVWLTESEISTLTPHRAGSGSGDAFTITPAGHGPHTWSRP